jgi:hypothetical protein
MAEEHDEHMQEVFEQMVREILPSTVITNFVMIAEVVSDDGTDLSLTVSSNITPWLAMGMLKSAEEMIVTGECKFPN